MRITTLLSAALSGLVFTTGALDAAVLKYQAVLSGAAEEPPNPSPGKATAALTVDTVARTFLLAFEFSDLVGTSTAAHIHGATPAAGSGTAGVMTQTPYFVGFPLGVTSGSFSSTYDMSMTGTWSPSFITSQGGTVAGAEATFLASLASGRAYLNIHSSVYGGGEVRGFFADATPVPLPAGLTLSLSALSMFGALGLRRRVLG